MLKELRKQALQQFRPPKKMDLAEFMETELRLPSSVSATSGRFQFWPYQRGIAEAISDPAIERVTLVKSVRIGLSTTITGTLANYVANDPSQILCVLPTEDDCRRFVTDDVEPVFDASPILRDKLASNNSKHRSTILARRFAGGSLRFIAAKSPRNLRAHNIRILMIDEADAMEVTKEGDPIALAENRTLSFDNRKIIMGSTPVDEETSNVIRAYKKSDQRIYEVPCTQCSKYFEILWEHIKWPEGEPEQAYCECPNCGGVIEETEKPEMVSGGRWRATAPEIKGHAGFRINALVSTLKNASWAILAAEFIEAKKSPDTLKAFVNTKLGQGWTDRTGEAIDEHALIAKAEPISLENIPEETILLTAGVDVQHDRLECTVLGWDEFDTPAIIDHSVFWGDVLKNDVWIELREHLKSSWQHSLGGQIGIHATAVDSSDGQTMDAVYSFTKSLFRDRVFAIKGDDGARPIIDISKSKKHKLFIVGVDTVKNQLSQIIPKTMRFSDKLAMAFFEQLTSEQRITKYKHGRPFFVWERISGKRAEALDCVVYAYAVRKLVKLSPDALRNGIRNAKAVSSVANARKPQKRVSSLMGGGYI